MKSNVETAIFIMPFLLIAYMSLARMLRRIQVWNRRLAGLLGIVCAVGIAVYGYCLEPVILEYMVRYPDPEIWSLVDGQGKGIMHYRIAVLTGQISVFLQIAVFTCVCLQIQSGSKGPTTLCLHLRTPAERT